MIVSRNALFVKMKKYNAIIVRCNQFQLSDKIAHVRLSGSYPHFNSLSVSSD